MVVILQLHNSLMKALQTHTKSRYTHDTETHTHITISSYMEKPGHPEKKTKKNTNVQLIPTAVSVDSTP